MNKVKQKLTKEQKQLLIALIIGDGTISNNNVLKLSHSVNQSQYLQWKIDLLKSYGFRPNGLKYYTSSSGYNKGKGVVYTQLPIMPTIKALRRTVYTPKKTFTRKLLDWLNPLGLAIWYMDDGFINVNTSQDRSSIQHTIKISTCESIDVVNMMITYFKETWGVDFRPYKERSKYYSLATRTEDDCAKFITIVKPYVSQVSTMLYKLRTDITKAEFLELQSTGSEVRDLLF